MKYITVYIIMCYVFTIGQSTCTHSFEEADRCQNAFHKIWDFSSAELRAQSNMPAKAPQGHLLVTMRNMQNDHASVELKRVDCIELAIQALINDDDFKLNRATCVHHKLGLFAEVFRLLCSTMHHSHHPYSIWHPIDYYIQACQRADAKIVTDRLGRQLDQTIHEFKTTNCVDMFQRQLALLFG